MCTHDVDDEAAELLAEILSEMAEAFAPGDGQNVVIGPVDFGTRR